MQSRAGSLDQSTVASFRARDRFNQKALFFTEAWVRPSDFAMVSMSTSASAKRRKRRSLVGPSQMGLLGSHLLFGARPDCCRALISHQPLHCACLGGVICFWLSDRPYGAVPAS